MNCTTFKTACFAATAVIALASCNKSAENDSDTLSFKRIEIEQSYRLDGSAADFGTDLDVSYGCKAQMLMPTEVFGHDISALRDSILSVALDTTGTDYAAIIAEALPRQAAECGYALTDTVLPDSIAEATPNFLARFDGFLSVEGDIETLSQSVMSYAVTTSIYLPGAAHGMYGTRYLNYDLDNGSLVTVETLFTPEGIAALPEIIRDTAVKMQSTIGKTDITSLPAFGNFYLTPDGNIVFAYQPYEVASYAQGEIQIPIPAYSVSEYLSEDGTALLL